MPIDFLNKFKAFKVPLFCLSIGGLFYIIFTIKMLLQIKHNTHNFCFRSFNKFTYNSKVVSILRVQNNTKKMWVHAYWLVCKSLKSLWYNCFVCLLVGYFTFFSRSKFYYRSNSMLISFVLVLSIEWHMKEYRIFYGTRVLHD